MQSNNTSKAAKVLWMMRFRALPSITYIFPWQFIRRNSANTAVRRTPSLPPLPMIKFSNVTHQSVTRNIIPSSIFDSIHSNSIIKCQSIHQDAHHPFHVERPDNGCPDVCSWLPCQEPRAKSHPHTTAPIGTFNLRLLQPSVNRPGQSSLNIQRFPLHANLHPLRPPPELRHIGPHILCDFLFRETGVLAQNSSSAKYIYQMTNI